MVGKKMKIFTFFVRRADLLEGRNDEVKIPESSLIIKAGRVETPGLYLHPK